MNKKSARFPMLVTIALLLWLTTFTFDSVLATPSTESSVVISDVQITNVRDVSFTVSWVTDQDSDGTVLYGTDPMSLTLSAQDVRGAATSDDTHYVTISGLSPETTYHFEVVSGATTSGGHSVTTGPTLGVPGSDTIFGEVFQSDGTTVAEGTIVKITLRDNNAMGSSGDAAPLSALVDANGFWNANLGNARSSDLSAYFQYSASGDQVVIEAQCAGDGTDDQTVDTADDTPAADMTCADDGPSNVIYVSTNSSGTVGGVSFDDEDILAYDSGTNSWEMYLDGSDVGLEGTNLNAFTIMNDGSILMSFETNIELPTEADEADGVQPDDEAYMDLESQSGFYLSNLGLVRDEDIVQFSPTSLGENSAGSFSVYLDGSTVGLSTFGENIDAIAITPENKLVISTIGNFTVPHVDGGDLTGKDEDLFQFEAASNSWSPYFDASDVGLAHASEDVWGAWIDKESGNVYLSTEGAFTVFGGHSGNGEDIFKFDPGSLGDTTRATYGPDLTFDGSAVGFNDIVDGLALNLAASSPPEDVIYVSTGGSGSIGGVDYRDEDIIRYDTVTGSWEMYFDGSDVGVGPTDTNAFTFLNDGSILISFDSDIDVPTEVAQAEYEGEDEEDAVDQSPESQTAFYLPEIGLVTDSDIVQFTPTSLGENTAGSFSLYLDGSTVGLSTTNEDIDALGFTTDGNLVISTLGIATVPKVGGGTYSPKDEDMFEFDSDSNAWSKFFDGSDVQLTSRTEDTWGTWIDPDTGEIYLTTWKAFNVSPFPINGEQSDIFKCDPGALGNTTRCVYGPGLYFDGSTVGFAPVIDGFTIVRSTSARPNGQSDQSVTPTSIELTSLSTSNITPFEQGIFIGVTLLLTVAGYGWHRRKK